MNALEELRAQLPNRGIVWSVRDMRPRAQREGLIPAHHARLVLFRDEEGAGISMTVLQPVGVNEDGAPIFDGTVGGYYKLLLAKHGQYCIGGNKPMRRLAAEGERLMDAQLQKQDILIRAFIHMEKEQALNILQRRLLAGEIFPARRSETRCPVSGTVQKVMRVDDRQIVIVQTEAHSRTIAVPSWARIRVLAGTAVQQGDILWDIPETDEPAAQAKLRHEAQLVYQACSREGMIRADIVQNNTELPYFVPTRWKRASALPTDGTVVETYYRRNMLEKVREQGALEVCGIV